MYQSYMNALNGNYLNDGTAGTLSARETAVMTKMRARMNYTDSNNAKGTQ